MTSDIYFIKLVKWYHFLLDFNEFFPHRAPFNGLYLGLLCRTMIAFSPFINSLLIFNGHWYFHRILNIQKRYNRPVTCFTCKKASFFHSKQFEYTSFQRNVRLCLAFHSILHFTVRVQILTSFFFCIWNGIERLFFAQLNTWAQNALPCRFIYLCQFKTHKTKSIQWNLHFSTTLMFFVRTRSRFGHIERMKNK